jgi:alkaline phosphatase D
MRIDRRQALAFLGLGAAGPAAAQMPKPLEVSFQHGVASGDPTQDSVILWTRITPETAGGEIAYSWALNPLGGRAGGAKRGKGVTGPARDYTVKVDVGGLDPGRNYIFSFEAQGVVSPAGRTRTLPVGPIKDVVLAFATCALFPHGYFNAYGAIAALPRVDAVVHLGDYIYEYGGPGSYGMDSKVAAQRTHDPDRECISLDDYRRRHAQYKTDPQTQAAHALVPWIVVWDDHETANDSYATGAQNHQPATEGDWNVRKAAAIKAYYEWMPIREPAGGGFAINRSFDFGDLASLFMLETRLTARDQQLRYGRDLPEAPTPGERAAFDAKLADPARKMMSAGQEAWLTDGLKASVTSGRTWQVIGNEVLMARALTPPIREFMGEAAYAAAVAALPKASQERMAGFNRAADQGLPYSLDSWDGYPADRQRVCGIFKATRAKAIVLSGDSHAFWANELYDAPEGGARVAVEFGVTSITSPGGGDALPTLPLGESYVRHNREVRFNDQGAKGFVLLTLTRREARAELMAVSTIEERAYVTRALKSFKVTPGADGVSALKET